jgi:hypothetical protein
MKTLQSVLSFFAFIVVLPALPACVAGDEPGGVEDGDHAVNAEEAVCSATLRDEVEWRHLIDARTSFAEQCRRSGTCTADFVELWSYPTCGGEAPSFESVSSRAFEKYASRFRDVRSYVLADGDLADDPAVPTDERRSSRVARSQLAPPDRHGAHGLSVDGAAVRLRRIEAQQAVGRLLVVAEQEGCAGAHALGSGPRRSGLASAGRCSARAAPCRVKS